MPYQIIYTDWFTFRSEFVDAFPQSKTRQVIFQNFSIYMEKLIPIIGENFYQWIDGNFVTRKLNPGDIDFVTFVDAKIFDKKEQSIKLLKDYISDNSLRLDGYFVKPYPEQHKRFVLYKLDSLHWLNEFVTDSRKGQPKGFIQLNF